MTSPTRVESANDKPVSCDPAAICALPPDRLEGRIEWIRSEILPHAIATERLEHGLAFELSLAPGIEEKLNRLVQLESECCTSIDIERVPSASPERARLEIRGVDPDAAIFASLGKTPSPVTHRGRLAKAAGAGVLGSLIVCCVLPIAAVAVLGGAVAPLLSLDGPIPILLGAMLGGTVTWWRLDRGRRARNETK